MSSSALAVSPTSARTGRGRRSRTKWDIFVSAVDLFSACGVEAVSIRTIANEVGIQPGSIYSHYASKDMLVQEMYDFLLEKIEEADIDQLIGAMETDSPAEVFSRAVFQFPSGYRALMHKIIRIAMLRTRTDEVAEQVIRYIYEERPRRLLGRLMPEVEAASDGAVSIDVEACLNMYTCMCFGACCRLDAGQGIDHEEWQRMNRQFFALMGF